MIVEKRDRLQEEMQIQAHIKEDIEVFFSFAFLFH